MPTTNKVDAALAKRWVRAFTNLSSQPAVDGEEKPIVTGVVGVDASALPLPAPFSFVYGGVASGELLTRWPRLSSSLSAKGLWSYEIVWREPGRGLECRMVLKAFDKYPAIDWIVYFKNIGGEDSAILEDVAALDVTWPGREAGPRNVWMPAKLWRSRGSQCQMSDFEYLEQDLPPGTRVAMVGGGGRSSQEWLPFFNLQTGGLGIFTAIGWTGQWAYTLETDAARQLHMRAGMEKTRLRLHPGEEIRSPRMLQMFWTGDRIDAHNRWRRLLMDHYVPRNKGKPAVGPLTMTHWGGMSTAGHLQRIAEYKKQRLPAEYYWVDAGWYGLNSTYSPDEFVGDWAMHTGDWRVNPKAHPNGLRPIRDAARDAGMKFLLWVEPERAVVGTHWTQEHPEWFLSHPKAGNNLLLNLGDEGVRKNICEFIAALLREHGVDLYRQDFNFSPLAYWRHNDAEDRQGMTEIRYVCGLYAFWDYLREQFPGMLIDNCASGGRRIDLETISRSIPLWRSDWQCSPDNDPVGGQSQGMGLNYWIPLHGSGMYNNTATHDRRTTYRARSTMSPAWILAAFPYEKDKVDPKYPWAWYHRMVRDFLRARPLFVGDYYPLTDAKPDPTQWAAWQMHRPDLGEGLLIAFRRKESPWSAATFKLRGVEAEATYELDNADTGRRERVKGQALLEQGVQIKLAKPDTSAMIFYRKVLKVRNARS